MSLWHLLTWYRLKKGLQNNFWIALILHATSSNIDSWRLDCEGFERVREWSFGGEIFKAILKSTFRKKMEDPLNIFKRNVVHTFSDEFLKIPKRTTSKVFLEEILIESHEEFSKEIYNGFRGGTSGGNIERNFRWIVWNNFNNPRKYLNL